jgi:murein DD-endopeptidase MepM/ murein hydrolase activator NlpD
MKVPFRVRPGWFLMAMLLMYAILTSISAQRTSSDLRALKATQVKETAEPLGPVAPEGLWFPIPGAHVPDSDAFLPGSHRRYRRGVSQGFDFYSGDSGVPIAFGTPVVAAASGELVRVDENFVELEPEIWRDLIDRVSQEGASDLQLNQLRGRQIWIRTADGMLLRYAHLNSVREGIEEGQLVYRGKVIGFAGNSGTDDGVQGTRDGVRLHFEIWFEEDFFGNGLQPNKLRAAAAQLFVGP